RRLCYVGITRAMKKLYMSCARTRYRFGEASYQSPSRFLEEIPKHLVELAGGRRHVSQHPAQGIAVRERNDPDDHYYSDETPADEYDGEPMSDLRVGTKVE